MKLLNQTDLFRSKLAWWSCAIALTCFATAYAGEEKNPVAAQLERPFDWTGFYIGGNLGAILSNYDLRGSAPEGDIFSDLDVAQQFYDTLAPMDHGSAESGMRTFFGPSKSVQDGAPIGGGQIGYNRQFGHFVIGIEGDFDRTSSSGENRFRDSALTLIAGDGERLFGITDFVGNRRAETNWTASIRGRVGYAKGPLLIYGTAGITWADVEVWASDAASTNFFLFLDDRPNIIFPGDSQFIGNVTNTNISRDDGVQAGWTAGGGLEWALSDLVTVGLEYRHNDFGSDTYHFASHGGPIFPGSTHVDLDSDQVTFKLNVLISHFFGHQDYASTTADTGKWAAKDENISVGYTSSAKDKNVTVMQAPEPFSWTGLYVGGQVGGTWTDYDFGRFDQRVDLDQQFDNIVSNLRPEAFFPTFGIASISFPGSGHGSNGNNDGLDAGSDASILGGGQIGYNQQFGHFVVGVEGDFVGTSSSQSVGFAGTTITNETTGIFEFAGTTSTATRKAEENWRASARLRLGYANGRLLLYATGGLALSEVRVWAIDTASTDFFDNGSGPPFNFGSTFNREASKDESVQVGYTAGGGAEWAFSKIASLGLEYRHNGFGDNTYNFAKNNHAIAQGSTRLGLDSDQVTFRLNILLGQIHGP